MHFNSFTITSENGYFHYPLPDKAPFTACLTLKGVDADEKIAHLALDGPLVILSQVHGTKVISAESARRYPEKDQADGVLISPGSVLCGLRYADCAPVLILSLSEHPWIMALHSGFRGTLNNIVASGMRTARKSCGVPKADTLYAWAGPCICRRCYSRKTDDPLTSEALGKFVPEAVMRENGLVYFDLKRQIGEQLLSEGVPAEHIYIESQCTCEQHELFYSHRWWSHSEKGRDMRMLLTVKTKKAETPVII
jgi:YfiH family protein